MVIHVHILRSKIYIPNDRLSLWFVVMNTSYNYVLNSVCTMSSEYEFEMKICACVLD